ncbi:MAG: hypothetical protein JO243_18795 [Solirubrobacterales bacterium]|nr:hypothetical protein [Solirubrobacterales bacterium]
MSQAGNPYSTLTPHQVTDLPPFPLDKPTSKVGKEAARLHQAAREATATLHKVRAHQSDLAAQLRAARAAFEEQAVSTEIDIELTEKLAHDLYVIERRCDPAILNVQNMNATRAQREAVRRYLAYAYENLAELVAELEPAAEAVAEKMAEALRNLEPVQAEYNGVRQRVFDLVGIAVAGPDAEHWAQALAIPDAPAVPIPSDGLAAFTRAQQPNPVEGEVVNVPEYEALEVELVDASALFGTR